MMRFVQSPNRSLPEEARAVVISKQLGDFIMAYTKETQTNYDPPPVPTSIPTDTASDITDSSRDTGNVDDATSLETQEENNRASLKSTDEHLPSGSKDFLQSQQTKALESADKSVRFCASVSDSSSLDYKNTKLLSRYPSTSSFNDITPSDVTDPLNPILVADVKPPEYAHGATEVGNQSSDMDSQSGGGECNSLLLQPLSMTSEASSTFSGAEHCHLPTFVTSTCITDIPSVDTIINVCVTTNAPVICTSTSAPPHILNSSTCTVPTNINITTYSLDKTVCSSSKNLSASLSTSDLTGSLMTESNDSFSSLSTSGLSGSCLSGSVLSTSSLSNSFSSTSIPLTESSSRTSVSGEDSSTNTFVSILNVEVSNGTFASASTSSIKVAGSNTPAISKQLTKQLRGNQNRRASSVIPGVHNLDSSQTTRSERSPSSPTKSRSLDYTVFKSDNCDNSRVAELKGSSVTKDRDIVVTFHSSLSTVSSQPKTCYRIQKRTSMPVSRSTSFPSSSSDASLSSPTETFQTCRNDSSKTASCVSTSLSSSSNNYSSNSLGQLNSTSITSSFMHPTTTTSAPSLVTSQSHFSNTTDSTSSSLVKTTTATTIRLPIRKMKSLDADYVSRSG